MNRVHTMSIFALALALLACQTPSESALERYGSIESPLLSCATQTVLGYKKGFTQDLEVVSLHGHLLLPETANAFYVMQQDALLDGVNLVLLLGFVEHELLTQYYDCSPKGECSCNNCNTVPYPGYSEHQEGIAIAIRATDDAIDWMMSHAADYGFANEIPGVLWYWTYDLDNQDPLGPCAITWEANAVQLSGNKNGTGYWILLANGQVVPFGEVQYFGSTEPLPTGITIVGMALTPTEEGYWLVDSVGQVYPFGDAQNLGDLAVTPETGTAVGIASYGAAQGYWIASTNGTIGVFGAAPDWEEGSVDQSTAPTVDLIETADKNGFWALRNDGSMSLYNAPFYGSLVATETDTPIASLSPTHSGEGYCLITEAGAIYPFGDAENLGSAAGLLDSPVRGLLHEKEDLGYWVLEEASNVIGFGQASVVPHSVQGYLDLPAEEPDFTIQLSLFADRSNPVPLEGATVEKDIFVFVSPNGEGSRARFVFDEDPVTGTAAGEDDAWPFDLAGGSPSLASPFDTYTLENGERTLSIKVERLHGLETSFVSATFNVDNPVCGDGIIEAPEECDSGPCCGEKCQLELPSVACRPTNGACDLAEFCTGTSPTCPEDSVSPSNLLCRESATVCDVAEFCTGDAPACPANQVLPNGTPCLDGGTCELGFCTGDIPDVVEEPDIEEEPDAGMDATEEPEEDTQTPEEEDTGGGFPLQPPDTQEDTSGGFPLQPPDVHSEDVTPETETPAEEDADTQSQGTQQNEETTEENPAPPGEVPSQQNPTVDTSSPGGESNPDLSAENASSKPGGCAHPNGPLPPFPTGLTLILVFLAFGSIWRETQGQ